MFCFQADGNVGTLFCPASPRPTVRRRLRRPDPPVLCPDFGLNKSERFWVNNSNLSSGRQSSKIHAVPSFRYLDSPVMHEYCVSRENT